MHTRRNQSSGTVPAPTTVIVGAGEVLISTNVGEWVRHVEPRRVLPEIAR